MNHPKGNPPKWAKRFFVWYCHETVAEDLIGDVDELFYINLQTNSVFKARWIYRLQLIRLLFSSGIRLRRHKYREANGSKTYHSLALYKSYGKISFRNLIKQRGFSLINITCLSVGMSVGLLALAVWIDVAEVDDFQGNASNIYRVTTEVDDTNEKLTYASSSAPLAEKLKEEVTGINEIVRMERNFNPEIILSDNTPIPFFGYFADDGFFQVFSFPLVEGNPKSALDKPFSIVVTQTAAEKLFRNNSPLGKILEVKGFGNFEVTGVVKDYGRSHLAFEVLASYSTLPLLERQGKIKPSLQDWGPVTNHYTYVLVNENKPIVDIRKAIENITSPGHKDNPSITAKYGLQPFKDITHSNLYNEIGQSWGDVLLSVFFLLALLVLLPACFNYANIAIARALTRAKEIGLRKVVGGESKHIVFQIVMETIILSTISLSGAALIFMAVRAGFLNMVVNGSKLFDLEITPVTFLVFLAFGICTGMLAGLFPAIYFSRLNPIEALRNASQSGHLSKISIRKGLIVVQFILSLFFILSVAIVFKQYRYAFHYNMGFQKENILDIPLKDANYRILETELRRLHEVSGVSMSSSIPGNWAISDTWAKPSANADSLEVYQMFVDQQYINNLELKLMAGSSFPETTFNDEKYVIVNETFVRTFNLGSVHDALNRTVVTGGKELRVAGVVKDFNYMPLREEIHSFFFRYDPSQFRYANVKLKSDNIPETLNRMERSWKKLTAQKFEAHFLDGEMEASIIPFRNMMKIFGFLGLLTITISCLGLLAVVISAVESRTKEMGIRKILGASMPDLAYGLSKGFLKLIGISILVATPVTYLIFDKIFLRMNYYRANIGVTEIVMGILLLLVMISVIIGSQTLRVANINPVETLKYE